MYSCSGIFLHCEAAKGPCALDMNDLADHVDLMRQSGHKMYGPVRHGQVMLKGAPSLDHESRWQMEQVAKAEVGYVDGQGTAAIHGDHQVPGFAGSQTKVAF